MITCKAMQQRVTNNPVKREQKVWLWPKHGILQTCPRKMPLVTGRQHQELQSGHCPERMMTAPGCVCQNFAPAPPVLEEKGKET